MSFLCLCKNFNHIHIVLRYSWFKSIKSVIIILCKAYRAHLGTISLQNWSQTWRSWRCMSTDRKQWYSGRQTWLPRLRESGDSWVKWGLLWQVCRHLEPGRHAVHYARGPLSISRHRPECSVHENSPWTLHHPRYSLIQSQMPDPVHDATWAKRATHCCWDSWTPVVLV